MITFDNDFIYYRIHVVIIIRRGSLKLIVDGNRSGSDGLKSQLEKREESIVE